MTKVNSWFAVLFFITAMVFSTTGCSGSKEIKGTSRNGKINDAIRQNNWTFVAENASPQYGNFRPLTSKYYVNFRIDSLNSDLPYFGRTYSGADVMTNQNPLGFISTNMSVVKDKDIKGAWIITVKPKDHEAVQAYTFTVYNNGNAQLMVTLTNRSPISFTGVVEPG